MRAFRLFAMTVVAMQFPPAFAQIGSQRPGEEIIAQTHAAFSRATSIKEIEAVELWCRDNLVLLSIREREGLMTTAISRLRNHEFEEANAAFERLRKYDQSKENFDDRDCEADLQDKGPRQRLQASAITTLSKSEAVGGAKALEAEQATRSRDRTEETVKAGPSSAIPAAQVRPVTAPQLEPPPETTNPATPSSEQPETTENARRPPTVAYVDPPSATPAFSQLEAAPLAEVASAEEEPRSREAAEAADEHEPSSPNVGAEAESATAEQSEPSLGAAKPTGPTSEPREATKNAAGTATVAHLDHLSKRLESPWSEATSLRETASPEEEASVHEGAGATAKADGSSSIPAAEAQSAATAQLEPPPAVAKPATPTADNAGRATTLAGAEQSSTPPLSQQPEVTLSAGIPSAQDASRSQEPAGATEKEKEKEKEKERGETSALVPAAGARLGAAAQPEPLPEVAKPATSSTEPPGAVESAGPVSRLAADEQSSTPPPGVAPWARIASIEDTAKPQEPAEATQRAETSPSVPAAEDLPPADEQARRLSAQGLVALAQGDVVGSRAYLQRAVEAGDVRAQLALGETYDPAMLVRMGARGIRGDADVARDYYTKALAVGVVAAQSEPPRESSGAAENPSRASMAATTDQPPKTPASQQPEVDQSARIAATEEASRPEELAGATEKAEPSSSVPAAEALSVARAQPPRPDGAELVKAASIESQGNAPSPIESTENGGRARLVSTTSRRVVASADSDTPPPGMLDRPIWILLSTPLSSEASGVVERDPWRAVAWWNTTIGAAPARSLWAAAEVASVSGASVEHSRIATRKMSRHDRPIYRYAAFRQFKKGKVGSRHTQPGAGDGWGTGTMY
jgi:hypothetical protein